MADRDYAFALGEIVKDKVTGFEGVVIGRGDHISGCDTYRVQPLQLKDGAVLDVKWFDVPRLESTGKRMAIVDTRERKTGADSVPQATHMR